MKAVVIEDFRTAPKVAELPVPEPADNEIVIRIHAAGLNPFDWKVIQGALEGVVPHQFPLVLGSDGAGVVDAVGSPVTKFRVGDRVFGQFMKVTHGRGSFAEYTVAPQNGKLALIPDELSFVVAAALPTASTTAYEAIAAAGLTDGQSIFINGASGGVGQAAVQFAARAGAHVIVTGTPDIAEYLRELGAQDVIDYKSESPIDHLKEVDVILDLVSASTEHTTPYMPTLKSGGLLISTNGAADVEALRERGLRGLNFSNSGEREVLSVVAEMAARGDLRVRIDNEVPIEEAPAAIERAHQGHARGKTVILT